MKSIEIFKAILLCLKYNKMSDDEKRKVRQERFELADLSVTTKIELMSHFDGWVLISLGPAKPLFNTTYCCKMR